GRVNMKKILLVLILLLTFTLIDYCNPDIVVGNSATDRGSNAGFSNWTIVDACTSADGTGKITTVEVWVYSAGAGCKVAIFYRPDSSGAPNNLTARDSEIVQIDGEESGVIPSGSKQTFTVDLDVVEGDFIGIYGTSGSIEMEAEASDGYWYEAGDQTSCINVEFAETTGKILSLRGIGATEEEEANAVWFGTNF
ncbi:unnamed protein product, partial [marine sediment metagenome]